MKAAILETLNEPLVIEDIEICTPLKVGQVLVKNIVSGLCGSQLLEIAGLKGNSKFVPHLLGHEGCGIVEQVGPGVSKVKPGQKVVLHWMKGDGIESDFPKYIFRGKTISSGKVTTLSEYSVVSENRMTVVADDADPELCALLGCSLTTALGTINNETNLKMGESIMILGCGGVGMNLIQGARLAGAGAIIACDTHSDKENKVKKLGATAFVNLFQLQSDKIIEGIVGKKGIDVIIDTTANTDLIDLSLGLLADGGRFIIVGHPEPHKRIHINGHNFFGMKGKTFKSTVGGKTIPQEDIPKYVQLHKVGLLKVDNIITHHYNLDDINSAIKTLREGACGRIIITI